MLVGIALLTASLLFFGVRAARRLELARLGDRWGDLTLLLTPGILGVVAIPFAERPGWGALDGVGGMLVVVSALLAYRVLRPGLWLAEHLIGVLGAGVVIHCRFRKF